MNIDEFISYRKKCVICGENNVMSIAGTLKEESESLGKFAVKFYYSLPVSRKKFTIFLSAKLMFIVEDKEREVKEEDLSYEKYQSLTFYTTKDDNKYSVEFDNDFNFKMKAFFSMGCPGEHYKYVSRPIRLTNTNNTIEKGFPVEEELIEYEKHIVVCSKPDNKTYIHKPNGNPIIAPYVDIATFPTDDKEKFIKRIENIGLLA